MKKILKNCWDYFFDPWIITIKEEKEETWCSYYSQNIHNDIYKLTGQEIPNSDYLRTSIVYHYKHKFSDKEKIVKKYLDKNPLIC